MTSFFLKLRKRKHKELIQTDEEYGSSSLSEYPGKETQKQSLYYILEGSDLKLTHKDKHPVSQKTKKKTDNLVIANYLNLGYYIVAPLLIGVFFGFWLDKMLNTKPIFVLIFLGGGIISSFYNLWKMTKEQ